MTTDDALIATFRENVRDAERKYLLAVIADSRNYAMHGVQPKLAAEDAFVLLAQTRKAALTGLIERVCREELGRTIRP